MKIDYQQLFELSYWFSSNPGFLSDTTAIALIVFFSLCIAGRIVLVKYPNKHVLDKPSRTIVSKVKTLLLTMGIIGYVMVFFSYQAVPLLSMRFFYLLWALITVLWIYFIWHYQKTEAPVIREAIQRKEQMTKYTLRKYPT